MQGGIERYLSTVLNGNPYNSFLVTEDDLSKRPQRIAIRVSSNGRIPKGMRYLLALLRERNSIKLALAKNDLTAFEFSRPELALFAWLLRGHKTFTIHGLGPPKKDALAYLIHRISCLVLPYAANVVQVFGRDPSGIPAAVVEKLQKRIKFIDAWYDQVFTLSDMPPMKPKILISIGGRLSAQKNPSLLFEVVRAVARDSNLNVEFRYHGADGEVVRSAGLENMIHCQALLTLDELADEIRLCHAGIMCSAYGEGSPFTIVESLACGRPFIAPPLRTLTDAYANIPSVIFASDWTVSSYLAAIRDLQSRLQNGLTAQAVSAEAQLERRSQEFMPKVIFERVSGTGV
jgi:glycosyltransferase involved in cell wall biosynthesis